MAHPFFDMIIIFNWAIVKNYVQTHHSKECICNERLTSEMQAPERVRAALAVHGYEPMEGRVKALIFRKSGTRYFTVVGSNGEKQNLQVARRNEHHV